VFPGVAAWSAHVRMSRHASNQTRNGPEYLLQRQASGEASLNRNWPAGLRLRQRPRRVQATIPAGRCKRSQLSAVHRPPFARQCGLRWARAPV